MCACRALLDDDVRNASCNGRERHQNHQPFCIVIVWVKMQQEHRTDIPNCASSEKGL